jgi:hypothetical protein
MLSCDQCEGFKRTAQLTLEESVMLVEGVDDFRRPTDAGFAQSRQDGFDHFLAENQQARQDTDTRGPGHGNAEF